MMADGKRSDLRCWACTQCAYEYDPEAGDTAAGIVSGTIFVDLPAGWRCPWCGAPKEDFEPMMGGGMRNRPEWD
jgi:rubredoxin